MLLPNKYYQIVRSLHKACPHMTKKKAMPGVRHQLSALENAPDLADDPEAIEDLEADFQHVGRTHRRYEVEMSAQRERVRHIMVKNKYFREQQLPNFLLYAEKEEMRNLYARDPEEWTLERLAESFPATTDIVQKILKGKWRPFSTKRIREHDEAVVRNWERIQGNKANEISLPPELREHLLKFAARTLNYSSSKEEHTKSLLPKLPTPKRTEFSSIITSCKQYAQKPEPTKHERTVQGSIKTENPPDPEDETYLLDKIQDKRKMRLEDWQKHNLQQFEQIGDGFEKQTTNDESKIIVVPENPSGTGYIEKFESNEIVVTAEDSKRFEMASYKERVHIPRKLWRKGGTYRVEDCYYDDDGEFLYRVPGMTGSQGVDSKKNNSSE